MTRHFPPPAPEATAVAAILIDATRCWREARDSGRPAQPCLFRTLDEHNCTMFAPVFDSLCLFYEVALGRPMTVGDAMTLSDDEHLLLGLMDRSMPRQYLTCSQDVGATLDCALTSTRIMLALTIGQPLRGKFH
jgi:hypothetical protein